MNNNTLIERLTAIQSHKDGYNLTVKLMLDDLIAEIAEELNAETAKSAGRGDAHRTITKLLKKAKKDAREALHYTWINADGLQCFCNGYLAFRLKEHLTLDTMPENITPIDLDKIMKHNTREYDEIDVPSIGAVKAFIAQSKAESKASGVRSKPDPIFDLGEGRPLVSAANLLDVLTVFPDVRIFVKRGAQGLTSIMYLQSKHGDGAFCPVRCKEDYGKRSVKADELAKAAQNKSADNEPAAGAPTAAEPVESDLDKALRIIEDYKARCAEDVRYTMPPETFAELVSLPCVS